MDFLLSIAVIHLIACLSPGPDILLVIQTSLRSGFRTALATVAGILSGVAVHILLGLTGVSVLIATQPLARTALALAGASYLLFLGLRGLLQTRPRTDNDSPPATSPASRRHPSLPASFRSGLWINLLNAKALLFFLSLFSVMLGPDVPLPTRILAGFTMLAVQAVAFSLVARLADQPRFRSAWPRWQHRLDLAISFLLACLGCWIWITQLASLAA